MSRIRITKARRKIKAQRDEQGVPHIEGTTMLDVLYGLGYMHAADRGTQLLFSRAAWKPARFFQSWRGGQLGFSRAGVEASFPKGVKSSSDFPELT